MASRARRKEQRPQEILDAAFEAFSERGFAATRLEDVAALAGVTKGTIYVYFETKEKLFEAMVRQYSSRMLADADAMLAATKGSSRKRLEAFLAFVYLRCARNRAGREIIRFIVTESKRFPRLVEENYRDFIAPTMLLVGDLLAEGAANGEFRENVTREAAEIILAPMVFLSILRLILDDGLKIDEDAYVAAHIDLALHGLLAPTSR
jgi:AcrR family transcriptional regulator